MQDVRSQFSRRVEWSVRIDLVGTRDELVPLVIRHYNRGSLNGTTAVVVDREVTGDTQSRTSNLAISGLLSDLKDPCSELLSSAQPLMSLGDELRKARTDANMTQEELSRAAKLDRAYISLLEHDRKSPTVYTLRRLCQAIGIAASTVLARVERAETRANRNTSGS